jgi:ubiquinone/menaquinone biosynthesis C-methylase UbiE
MLARLRSVALTLLTRWLNTVLKKLVRFGFRLLYNEMAWTYDAVSWAVSLGRWRSWQRTALPHVIGTRVLELGHGPGHILVELASARYRVTGLDLSPYMGRLARRRVSTPLVRGRVQQLPFPPATFDSVLSIFPTEYITSPESLAAIRNVLAPDGRLIIVPEAHLTGTGPLYRFIDWLFVITGQREGSLAGDEAALGSEQSQWRLFRQHLEEAGFQPTVEPVRLQDSVVIVVISHKRC